MYMFPIAEFGEQMHYAKFYEQYWKTEPGKQKIPRIVVWITENDACRKTYVSIFNCRMMEKKKIHWIW